MIAVAFAWLAACASDETASNPAQFQSLAAPTPADVTTKIVGSAAGQTVSVKKGARIAVELVGTPTAGFLWRIAETPAFLTPAGGYGGPTSAAQLEPGFAGGSHWEAFLFDVTAAGEGDLRFRQGRAWEDEPDADGSAFSVRIIAEE